jgi:hypothetical protein
VIVIKIAQGSPVGDKKALKPCRLSDQSGGKVADRVVGLCGLLPRFGHLQF